MVNWWFGILGVPLSNNPFHKGYPKDPNHQPKPTIIPMSNWLIPVVNMSFKQGCSPSKWPNFSYFSADSCVFFWWQFFAQFQLSCISHQLIVKLGGFPLFHLKILPKAGGPSKISAKIENFFLYIKNGIIQIDKSILTNLPRTTGVCIKSRCITTHLPTMIYYWNKIRVTMYQPTDQPTYLPTYHHGSPPPNRGHCQQYVGQWSCFLSFDCTTWEATWPQVRNSCTTWVPKKRVGINKGQDL